MLRQIPERQPVLFACGKPIRAGAAVGIVGARRATRGGREVARKVAADLARAGVVVVSGFARGIDAESHRGALEGDGPTVAVLGCGVDVCYPSEQEELFA